jgi:hypothetical protein
MKAPILILSLFLSGFSSFSQEYDFTCGDVGYETYSGGGTFLNVDGSGIDITISGMANDFCNSISIETGINNGVNDGVVHTYTYTFSEPVDMTMSISDINVDLELPCYYDPLYFSGDPIFTDAYNVSVEGDTIFPIIPSGMPSYCIISYEDITTFTIIHGDGGTSCNPGVIRISNMKFTPLKPTTSVAELNQNSLFIVNSFVQNELTLKGDFEILPELYICDILGRKIEVSYTIGEALIVDSSMLPNGQYFLYFEQNDAIKVERFIVSH